MALPMMPVAVLVGDGGFMFSMPEILTAKEQNLSIPIIIWENGGFKQIKDDMNTSQIDPIGVEGLNPDFAKLADACHCKSAYANSEGLFIKSVSYTHLTLPTILRV